MSVTMVHLHRHTYYELSRLVMTHHYGPFQSSLHATASVTLIFICGKNGQYS
jgi:hypothetical protein